jgi:Xaa-Pro aminopeptidase
MVADRIVLYRETVDYEQRVTRAQRGAAQSGIDAFLITPGADLRYLIGYDAVPLERLTCFVLPAAGDPFLLVPQLEELAARASAAGDLGFRIQTWSETDDPFRIIESALPKRDCLAVDDRMWAAKALAFQSAFPSAAFTLAGTVLNPLRMQKSAEEIAALERAGAAIDSVHAQVPNFLAPGRSEREVAADIGEAILNAGHVRVDFIIVGSGPNGASPHHEVSDRVLQVGDPIVVDIGGTMPDGYRSDCTRTYALGTPETQFLEWYEILLEAQARGVAAVQPGVTCAGIDAVTREYMSAAGIGDLFIHRTGHGIGLETHEDPYLVQGNELRVDSGMAFSVEPGFYAPDRFGARIEDIVVCTENGVRSLNHRPHTLIEVG